ncbi:MAG: hypothetical protein L6R19_27915 [Alphaproteobacteria bacterium]|nr:hypothetical protein [Alphaproteobacteria bacterium]
MESVDAALLARANWWFEISRYGLIISGSITAILAFVAVVFSWIQFWSSSVREDHSNQRTSTLEFRAAELRKDATRLTADAEASRAAIAAANARAAEANQKAELERLERIKLEARVSPRRLSGEQSSKMATVLSAATPQPIAVVSRLFDPEGKDFADDLASVLKNSGWDVQRFVNWTQSERGVFIAMVGQSEFPQSVRPLAAALDAASIAYKDMNIGNEALSTMSPYFAPNVLYLLIGAKP